MNKLKLRKIPKGTRRGVLKSTLEKNTQLRLRKLTKGKKINVEYETHTIPYTVSRNYIPDFVCSFPNGRVVYIECKGWFRPEDRTKMLSVKRNNPGLDIRLVFSHDNKLNKTSKTRYSDWCRKNNFDFVVGEIPKDWW